MKRFFALAALLLGLAACQTEPEGLDVNVGGAVDTTITVAIPEGTRASSADGFDLSTLANTDYSLRYILEIYRVDDSNGTCQRHVLVSDNKSVAFPVRLVPGYNYNVVVWADIVEGNSEADRYYKTTDGLDAITIIENNEIKWNAMDETRDAYTATATFNNFQVSQLNTPISLTRPFAKLRVVATDIEDIRKVGLEPTTATVAYSQEMYRTFDARTGVASGAASKSHTISYATPAYEDATGEYTLFADYFFVPSTGTAKFTLTVNAAAGVIKENNFNTEIFVQRNKLTTIKGDVLTVGGNVEVKVENELGQLETINYADNAETLQEIINEAPVGEQTNITLGGDIVLGEGVTTLAATRAGEPTCALLIPAGKKVVLDLNGHTISQSKAQTGAYAMIDNKGTLTIEDSSENKSGKIAYGDNGNGGSYVSNTISNSGVLTINGGTIVNNSSATVASNGYPHPIDNSGELTINGGTFTNNANYSTMRIWCTTDDDTIVTINGGTFNGSIDFQTPNAAANKGTLTINGGTFNADTYTNCSVRLLGFGADVDEMNGYIKGGHFNGAIALKNWSGSELNSKVFDITGGTFTTDPSEFVDDDYNVVENNDVYSLELKDVIAKIGEVEYRSLQKAFDAVDNGTIQLVGDVTLKSSVVLNEGKVVTLDLNGKTITATDYAIENFGTLKINGNGTIDGIVYCEATGNTTVENGTFNATESGKYVFLNSQGGTLTINGGTINGGSSYPIYSYDENSSLVINDVTVNATFGCVNAYGTNGSVVINGGTYQMTGVQGKTSHIAYFSNVDATINGGTFQKTGDINMSGTGGGGICAINGANLTINGGNFAGDHSDVYNWSGTNANGRAVAISIKGGSYKFKPNAAFVAEGCEVTEANGVWNVRVLPVAQIGSVEYTSFEEAIAAVKTGDTITLLRDITLAEQLGLPAGIIFNGNGMQINGTIYAGGDLTFVGHTKVTSFSASYYDRVITISEGACLEVTGSGRVTLGYGNTFNITGSIEDAKTADKATIQPSLIIPGGISITGDNDATMNVTNAYISLGNTSSKNSAANGEFTLNFTNSIIECTNQFTLSEPTGGKNPEFNVNITNSVMTTTAKLCIAAENSEVVVNNSILDLKNNFRNSGTFTLTNGSKMTGSTIQFGENGGNNGTINVDASTLTITAGSTGHAFDGKGIGKINATNGATVSVDYYKDMTITVDETSTFVGTDIYGNRKIYYVSDEMALAPTNPNALGGAKVVSNVWDKTTGKGVITFDRDLTTIGEKAFQRVTNTTPSNWATSITLPESVETIGDYAFAQCYSLTTINIPDSVTSIGQYAFQSCDAVTSVTIGSGVTSIGSGAFYNCYEINEIICESTTAPALADTWVFNGVDKTATVYVPAASVDTYKDAEFWSVFTNIVSK